MKKKKIAIVVKATAYGGVEKALIEFLNVLDYEKIQIVLYLQDDTGLVERLCHNQVIVKKWGKDSNTSRENLRKQIKSKKLGSAIKGIYCRLMARRHINSRILSNWYSCRCLPMLSEEEYDCAIAFHNGHTEVVARVLYCLYATKKVLWIHGKVDCEERALRYQEYEYFKFERVYCVSKAIKEWFCTNYPKLIGKTAIIHNFVNEKNILLKADEKVSDIPKGVFIVTVGRLSQEKGQEMIPAIARTVLDKGYDFTWYLIGDGALKSTIKERIEYYNVKQHVILIGEKQNPYPYIKKCHIYVQTSLSEGWGLTVQEARILKKPIVVTPEPAFREQITDGKNGIISNGKTPEALSDSICLLLEREELRKEIVKNLGEENPVDFNELQDFYRFIDE